MILIPNLVAFANFFLFLLIVTGHNVDLLHQVLILFLKAYQLRPYPRLDGLLLVEMIDLALSALELVTEHSLIQL